MLECRHFLGTDMHILINRNDNIGDVVLALPMAYVLKKYHPDCRISFCGRAYTKAIIKHCPSVDFFVDSEALMQTTASHLRLQDNHYDVFINAHACRRMAQLAYKAHIPLRIGSAHRWYHWCYCQHRIWFSRARSTLHEAKLNLKLLAPLAIPSHIDLPLPELVIERPLPTHLASLIDKQKQLIILHPGSNGNGKEWSSQRYLELMHLLPAAHYQVLLTGSANEAQRFQDLITKAPHHVHSCMGQLSLEDLLILIRHADGLVASGTGPLHVAAALGRPVIGLFPNHPIIGPKRWGPLGKRADFLCPTPRCQHQSANCTCMELISADSVYQKLETIKK